MSTWVRIGGAQNDGLFRHSVTKVIKFRKYRDGKGEIDRSCKTTDIAKARRKRDELMSELWGDTPLRPKRETALEVWDIWATGMKASKSPKTAESIRTARVNLEPYIKTMFVDEITEEWWLNEYIPQKRMEPNKRKGLDNSKRKFFNEWKWLSGMLKWAERNRKGPDRWVRPKLVNPDGATAEGRIYTDDELKRLRANAGLRMFTFLVAGTERFMRRSEIKNLEWSRVDIEARVIKLRKEDTKIRKARLVPFNDSLRDLFLELKSEADAMGIESAYVFPTLVPRDVDEPMSFSEFRTMWETCCEKAGLPKGSRFHWLRHTGLTKATRVPGVNLIALCLVAGLSIEELQKTYLHYSIDDLRGVESPVGWVT